MKITYYGHSVFLLEDEGFKGIIDPYINGNDNCSATVDEFIDITHIFITHGHGDHIGDAVELAQKTGAIVIANYEIINYLSTKGLTNLHAMHIGGKYSFDFVKVKMTNAVHGSGIMEGNTMICGGNPGGFIIETKSNKIYHAGDTGLTMDMKLLEDENIDIAMLPIGGNFTMDAEDAVRAVEFIKPKIAIPMHYSDSGLIKTDPMEFENMVEDAVVIVMDSQETIELDR
jgi:L-ascorbate metabolism protein UlaG (beta-lactamase superfamily)